ncbi:hypothetical protein CLCR_03169 [Cladophialophora carrionii]|uniref:Uncharacterized protein n=1 Tax=Cladophialophora carrionii TaxID=86049 RepID=A0A1C1D1E0_9EURO|nr:hypothetical protein CLCR_03169 [Cladophialophora carrionii]
MPTWAGFDQKSAKKVMTYQVYATNMQLPRISGLWAILYLRMSTGTFPWVEATLSDASSRAFSRRKILSCRPNYRREKHILMLDDMLQISPATIATAVPILRVRERKQCIFQDIFGHPGDIWPSSRGVA